MQIVLFLMLVIICLCSPDTFLIKALTLLFLGFNELSSCSPDTYIGHKSPDCVISCVRNHLFVLLVLDCSFLLVLISFDDLPVIITDS